MYIKYDLGDEVFVTAKDSKDDFVGTIYGVRVSMKGDKKQVYYIVDGRMIPENRLTLQREAKYNPEWYEFKRESSEERETKRVRFMHNYFRGKDE